MPMRGYLLGLLLISHDDEEIAGIRHPGEADHLNWHGRSSGKHLFAAVILHGAHPPVVDTRDEVIATLQGTFLDQDGGYRTTPLVELSLDDGATSRLVRVGLQVEDVRL